MWSRLIARPKLLTFMIHMDQYKISQVCVYAINKVCIFLLPGVYSYYICTYVFSDVSDYNQTMYAQLSSIILDSG